MEVEDQIQEKIEEEEASLGGQVKAQFNDFNDQLFEEAKNDKKNFNSRFISVIAGIPRFNLNKRQKSEEITELGLRHHTGEPIRPERKSIYDKDELKPLKLQEKLMSKKQSKVEVMNIRFDLPPPSETNKVEPKLLSKTVKNFHKT